LEPSGHADDLLRVQSRFTIEGPSSQLAFARNGYLIRATMSRMVEIYDLKQIPTLVHTFDHHAIQQATQQKLHTAGTLIHSIALSDDGQWLATGDGANNINIFNLEALKVRF